MTCHDIPRDIPYATRVAERHARIVNQVALEHQTSWCIAKLRFLVKEYEAGRDPFCFGTFERIKEDLDKLDAARAAFQGMVK